MTALSRCPTGRTFDQVIAEALGSARCVIVVWSEESIGSDWVREEADEGRHRGTRIPVLIDGARPAPIRPHPGRGARRLER